MIPARTLALVVVASLGVSACGSDSGGDSDEEARQVLLDSFEEDDDFPATPEQQECVADRTVEGLGGERVIEIDEEVGFEGDFALPVDEAEIVADAVVECVDFGELVRDQIANDPTVGDVPDTFIDCLLENFDNDLYKQLLTDEFSGEGADDDVFEELFSPAVGQECVGRLTPEEIAELTGG